MLLKDWVGYESGSQTITPELVEAWMSEFDRHRGHAESEHASAVSFQSGQWRVAIATEIGCHVLIFRAGDRETGKPTYAFQGWRAARDPDVWLTGSSPLDLTVSAFAEGGLVELAGQGPAARALIEFARFWASKTDQTIGAPPRGARLLSFDGGPLNGMTFRIESRTPPPAELAGEALGERTGRYVRGSRVEPGGPFGMNWTASE